MNFSGLALVQFWVVLDDVDQLRYKCLQFLILVLQQIPLLKFWQAVPLTKYELVLLNLVERCALDQHHFWLNLDLIDVAAHQVVTFCVLFLSVLRCVFGLHSAQVAQRPIRRLLTNVVRVVTLSHEFVGNNLESASAFIGMAWATTLDLLRPKPLLVVICVVWFHNN